ncbi:MULTISPECIES: AraC family transcriptional regulator [unclassified Paenibacillus]|uniref:AraC family transcriptional regulator n=1 Tax=unclassified Paenibacillus TaxID=185978 RepID=UPI002405BA4B|nr:MULTISPECIES: AraC family transcriptional regulator [unclassified Paenibacillus]MDF9839373.1 two-component system response regulator YesN [Paenibacillus sp. PastF-2]MDF9845954.1 two-component system response regulator YesN [Paenibacillus sp. PastM-2]MDF9852527.1 two-component system response regulator YesN [Paenibacillus sp. PastF-1]MDH6477743.1 two-component system response regulator YesN [Paenibacillus sp. PastH-2]MDH6505482.1 two-component system response regulator YesN [Paenibacillus sp
MSRMRHFLLKKSLLIRIILSYLFVGMLIIAALTLAITSKVSDSLKQELTESTDRSLEQSYNTANILLSSAYQQFANAYASADIQAGFYANAFDTGMMGRIGNSLTDLVSSNPLVHSVYLVNTRHELVFSSLTTARSFADFYDWQILELLSTPGAMRGSIFIPRTTSFTSDTKPFSGNLISVAYMSTRDDQTANGAMILNLDQQVLQEMMMNGAGSSSFQSMILNRQGIVISHSEHSMISSRLTGSEAVNRILQSDSGRGVIETELDGTAHRLFYIKSDSLGWVFIGDVNYMTLLSQVNELRSYILIVTAVILVAVLLSGAFFTRMIYSPIHRLVKNIPPLPASAAHTTPVSEYAVLSGAFQYLESRVQDLQNSMAGYHQAERNDLLHQLVTGGWSQDTQMRNKLERSGIPLTGDGFQICMLRLDDYSELTETYTRNDLMLLKYGICNIAGELGLVHFPLYSFDGGEDRINLLLIKPEGRDALVAKLLTDIQHNTERFLKLSVTASTGRHAAELQQIPASWQSAYNASRYRLQSGRRSLIPADIEDSREPVAVTLSAAMEKQVSDGMKLGDYNRTVQALKEYFAILGDAPFDETMILLNQLLFTVARTSKAMAGADRNGLSTDIGALGQQLYKCETLEQAEEWFAGLAESAISMRDKQSSEKNVMIVEKIRQHIRQAYMDPNLSVEVLAEIAGLSVNYTRKIFKDIACVSLNQYISDYRFEQAKELLLTTDLPANRIGEMVGINNTKYFYISFKKYSGKTPDHFRKSRN